MAAPAKIAESVESRVQKLTIGKAINLGLGTLSICTYQRSTNSVKASISLNRLLATGLMVGSSAASMTQARSASTASSKKCTRVFGL